MTGLAALAALLLLLLLKKKKRKEELEEVAAETTMDTIQEHEAYISEYGLSDAANLMDDDEIGEDLPRAALEDGNFDSDTSHASEHNPDELEDEEMDLGGE